MLHVVADTWETSRATLVKMARYALGKGDFCFEGFGEALVATQDLWDAPTMKLSWNEDDVVAESAGYYNARNASLQRVSNAKLSIVDDGEQFSEVHRSLRMLQMVNPAMHKYVTQAMPKHVHPWSLRQKYAAVTDYCIHEGTAPSEDYLLWCGWETTLGVFEAEENHPAFGFDYVKQFNDIAGAGAWERESSIQDQLCDKIRDTVTQYGRNGEYISLFQFVRSPWLWGTSSGAAAPDNKLAGWPKGRANKYRIAAYLSQVSDSELTQLFDENRTAVAVPFIKYEFGKCRVASNIDIVTYLRDAWVAHLAILDLTAISPITNTGATVSEWPIMRSSMISNGCCSLPADASKWDQQQTLMTVGAYYSAKARLAGQIRYLSPWERQQLEVYTYSHSHPELRPTKDHIERYAVRRVQVTGSVLSGLFDTALMNTVINHSSIQVTSAISGVEVVWSQSMGDDMDIVLRSAPTAVVFARALLRVQKINLAKSFMSMHRSQMLRKDFTTDKIGAQVGRAVGSILYRHADSTPSDQMTAIRTVVGNYHQLLNRMGAAPQRRKRTLVKLMEREVASMAKSAGIPEEALRAAEGNLAVWGYKTRLRIAADTWEDAETTPKQQHFEESFATPPHIQATYSATYERMAASMWRDTTPLKVAKIAMRDIPVSKEVFFNRQEPPDWVGGYHGLEFEEKVRYEHNMQQASSTRDRKGILAEFVPMLYLNRFPVAFTTRLFSKGMPSLAPVSLWSAELGEMANRAARGYIWGAIRHYLWRKGGTNDFESWLVSWACSIPTRLAADRFTPTT